MTEQEALRWKTIIDSINSDIIEYEMREETAERSDEARAYSSATWALKSILEDIHDILHTSIADEYQERMKKDIASMEQGYGGE